MKKLLMVLVLMPLMALADKETVDGIEWTYTVSGGKAQLGGGSYDLPAISPTTTGKITIPSTLGGMPVAIIGEYAFNECCKLTSVMIPSGVTSIRGYAFRRCSGLISVTLPPSVKLFENLAFGGCSSLTSIFVEECADASYCSVDGVLYRKSLAELMCCPEGKTGTVSIPSTVMSVAAYAFNGCSRLTSITIPPSVTSIGYAAFSGCSGLLTVTIPSNVTSVEDWSFSDCSGLQSITIPSGVTSIGKSAFRGCDALLSVRIPSSVKKIGDAAFTCCGSLLSVYYEGNAPFCGDGIYGDIDAWGNTPETLVSYVRAGTTGWDATSSMDLPDAWQDRSIAYFDDPVVIDGIEWYFRISNGKFASVRAVGGLVHGSVTVPSEINGYVVKKIGEKIFSEQGDVTSVVIPASVRTIESKAFADCSGLDSVTFLGDAPYVYDDAFCGTKSSLSFVVPQGSIGWSDTSLTLLPGVWRGRAIKYAGGEQGEGWESTKLGTVTVSNVVVHYVLNSVQPQFAISPSQDIGFVNIITEVKSTGVAAIPMSWAMSYPNFVSKFGSDFTAALGKPTGKIGTGGTPMLVWQDYVAGTDPTDEKDVFTASITIVDGKVTISYTPELDDARKAMRKYTILGKRSLMDTDWTEVQDGHEPEYNFFKVSVEMR